MLTCECQKQAALWFIESDDPQLCLPDTLLSVADQRGENVVNPAP